MGSLGHTTGVWVIMKYKRFYNIFRILNKGNCIILIHVLYLNLFYIIDNLVNNTNLTDVPPC